MPAIPKTALRSGNIQPSRMGIMKGWAFTAKMLLAAVLLHWAMASPALAQEKPVMENVFFNVVWGSAVGAVLGISTAIIGSDDHSAPSEARSSAFTGATVGGLAGLGIGLYLEIGRAHV